MRFVDQLQMLDRMDQLIRLKCTGNSKTLSLRLGISRRNVYYLLDILKELGAQIEYCKKRKSFFYVNNIKFSFLDIYSTDS